MMKKPRYMALPNHKIMVPGNIPWVHGVFRISLWERIKRIRTREFSSVGKRSRGIAQQGKVKRGDWLSADASGPKQSSLLKKHWKFLKDLRC